MRKEVFLRCTLLGKIYEDLVLNHKKRKWKVKNPHNDTWIVNNFDINLVEVGNNSYGELKVVNFGKGGHLKIGHYVSIAQECAFMLNAEHSINHLSTYPFKVKVLNEKMPEAFSKGDIIIEDDVWIGYRSIIMSGVHIGQGAVIAAGTIVTKDVPPYAIVGGIPAKIIKYRFKTDIREKLMKVDYGKIDRNMIKNKIDFFYDEKVCDGILPDWIPQKNSTD